MPPSRKNVLYGAAGTVGGALIAWRSMFPWIGDDLTTMLGLKQISDKMNPDLDNGVYIIDKFEEHVKQHPKKVFLYFEDREYSYELVDAMANKIANIILSLDISPGDTVAAMIQNEPSFVWTLLGLQKIGMVDAFINYHLTAEPLLHSIRASNAKAIIVGSGEGLLESIEEIRNSLSDNIPMYVQGRSKCELPPGYHSLDDAMERTLPLPLSKHLRSHVTLTSPVCYIYTSGTTGLPKPAICNQAKAIGSSKIWSSFGFNAVDVSYAVTPLYHSGATFLCLFNTIAVGCTMALRRKFSARHYWEDCRKYKVTVVHYIGELFRYILKVPESPLDGVHNIRVAMGNGLRLDVWKTFQDRFKIPMIVEHFGATEGTSITINLTNRVGAIGRISPLMRLASKYKMSVPVRVIRFDRITEEPIRGKDGYCIDCGAGENGLIISAVPETTTQFYLGSKAINEKKFLRDVFVKDDAYFNFGDVVAIDKDYYLYFRDRLGDTFRWKSENVSTREVAEVLSTLSFIQDINVYGVEVPDNDGKAGMAAILLKDDVSVTPEILQQIYRKCAKSLPGYARPIFLRFQANFEVTQTMKHRKVDLVKEGYNPDLTSDPLYCVDVENKTFSPLVSSSYQQVIKSRL
ncbi:very long-chain acyl-CoA synthetase-like [Mizuhopecten yessoensis]|uniref:long-chain-fatty-acid--CoA ligase n=1 Tax=Mizuhopecten yessoensis TaxID=6573 RepID=A0A210QYZ8_MIZYE|nr:very long-chain acyl-CoA synthetase-like [Mizuhopecten yessoensis]OWF53947.1 Very long-chain acyl-CoA synthetase [Mizuhopecten yessoensis]